MARATVLLLVLLCPGLALGESTGIDSSEVFEPIGCGDAGGAAGCHSSAANPGLPISVNGRGRIDPGSESYELFTASVPPDFDPALKGAGINVRLGENSAGCLLEPFLAQGFGPIDVFGSTLSHVYSNALQVRGVWAYQFLVGGCDQEGTTVVHIAMNAVDSGGTADEDTWNRADFTLTVAAPEPASAGFWAILALVALGHRREAGRRSIAR